MEYRREQFLSAIPVRSDFKSEEVELVLSIFAYINQKNEFNQDGYNRWIQPFQKFLGNLDMVRSNKYVWVIDDHGTDDEVADEMTKKETMKEWNF